MIDMFKFVKNILPKLMDNSLMCHWNRYCAEYHSKNMATIEKNDDAFLKEEAQKIGYKKFIETLYGCEGYDFGDKFVTRIGENHDEYLSFSIVRDFVDFNDERFINSVVNKMARWQIENWDVDDLPTDAYDILQKDMIRCMLSGLEEKWMVAFWNQFTETVDNEYLNKYGKIYFNNESFFHNLFENLQDGENKFEDFVTLIRGENYTKDSAYVKKSSSVNKYGFTLTSIHDLWEWLEDDLDGTFLYWLVEKIENNSFPD